ncbi:MAG: hypothetical protein ACI837_000974 [Crocinitomicaceae bacterium]|jgi:hypothetical protein
MKWRILLLAVWLISVSVHKQSTVKPVFGVKVSIGANSQMTTFACYLNNGRVLTHKRIVDANTFVKIVSGFWPSIYNPQKENLFLQNGIDCSVIVDSTTFEKVPSCIPLDSLWKIRFSTYPFRGATDMGWSTKYHKPGPNQEIYLHERYGINHIDGDFFLDTSFWMLLNDVMDPLWIKNYKSIE